MKNLLFLLLISCAHTTTTMTVITNDGKCQQSFVEDLTPFKYQVIYFCGRDGSVVVEIEEKAIKPKL